VEVLLQGYSGPDPALQDAIFKILYATDENAEFVAPGDAASAGASAAGPAADAAGGESGPAAGGGASAAEAPAAMAASTD
jgi:hypothetical protein